MPRPMSQREADALLGKKKRGWMPVSSKEARTVDGHTFRSLAEAKRYSQLRMLERYGQIRNLRFGKEVTRYDLADVKYTPDFEYERTTVWLPTKRKKGQSVDALQIWLPVVEEVKRRNCPAEVMRRFRRNQKQMKRLHGIDVELVRI